MRITLRQRLPSGFHNIFFGRFPKSQGSKGLYYPAAANDQQVAYSIVYSVPRFRVMPPTQHITRKSMTDQLFKLNPRIRYHRTSATPIMCTLKKQCYACKGACVEQVIVYCPKYLAGQDCGESDMSRVGQSGGMLLQEILHLSPCPKHGIDNPHDPRKITDNFRI
jgi:hypothetical protein